MKIYGQWVRMIANLAWDHHLIIPIVLKKIVRGHTKIQYKKYD